MIRPNSRLRRKQVKDFDTAVLLFDNSRAEILVLYSIGIYKGYIQDNEVLKYRALPRHHLICAIHTMVAKKRSVIGMIAKKRNKTKLAVMCKYNIIVI